MKNDIHQPAPQIAPATNVTISLAAACIGLSEKAIRRKIEGGKWLAGVHYFKAPDGGIFINLKGVQKWIESGL